MTSFNKNNRVNFSFLGLFFPAKGGRAKLRSIITLLAFHWELTQRGLWSKQVLIHKQSVVQIIMISEYNIIMCTYLNG